MKKLSLSLLALAALSTASFAIERTDADSSEKQRNNPAQQNLGVDFLQAPAANDGAVLNGRFGVTRDPAELRRWDEKNG